jgi:hypothetical protein
VISFRKISRVVRMDRSKNDLQRFKRDGYEQVVFVKSSYGHCVERDPNHNCNKLDGSIFKIDDLLKLDSPTFRISHPNCLCKFYPYGNKKTNKPNLITPMLKP